MRKRRRLREQRLEARPFLQPFLDVGPVGLGASSCSQTVLIALSKVKRLELSEIK